MSMSRRMLIGAAGLASLPAINQSAKAEGLPRNFAVVDDCLIDLSSQYFEHGDLMLSWHPTPLNGLTVDVVEMDCHADLTPTWRRGDAWGFVRLDHQDYPTWRQAPILGRVIGRRTPIS